MYFEREKRRGGESAFAKATVDKGGDGEISSVTLRVLCVSVVSSEKIIIAARIWQKSA